MAERKQVAYDPTTPSVNPSVKLLDSFVRPGAVTFGAPTTDDPSGLSKLSKELGVAGDHILSSINSRDNKIKREAELAGIEKEKMQAGADLLKNRMGYEDAVKQGLISPEATPWYRNAYQQKHGELTGDNQYGLVLNDAIEQSGFAQSDFKTETEAGAALNKLIDETRSKFLAEKGTDDPYWSTGFDKARDRVETAAAGAAGTARMKANREKFEVATQTQFNGVLADDTLPPEVTLQRLTAIGQQSVGTLGMGGKEYNKMAADSIAAAARTATLNGDYDRAEALVELGHKIPAGKGGYLGGITYAQGKLNEASDWNQKQYRDEVRFEQSQEDRPAAVAARDFGFKVRAHTLETWAKDKENSDRTVRVRAASDDLMAAILSEPHKVDFTTNDRFKALQKDDPEKARALFAFKDTVLDSSGKVRTDQPLLAAIYNDMMVNPAAFDVTRLVTAANAGKLESRDMTRAWSDWRAINSKSDHPYMQSELFKDIRNGLKDGIKGKDETAAKSERYDATRASVELQIEASHWLSQEANKTKSRFDFIDHMSKVSDRLFAIYSSDGYQGALSTKRPLTKGNDNPFTKFKRGQ